MPREERESVLILDVCCFTKVKDSPPSGPSRGCPSLGTLEIGRRFVPLPVSLISLCVFISVDKKEAELPGYQDPLFIVLNAPRPHATDHPISDLRTTSAAQSWGSGANLSELESQLCHFLAV